MIAVDTNIVVRLLVKDDERQYHKSVELFQQHEIFISNTVILETEWVLRFAYKFKPGEICQAFRFIFGLPNVEIDNSHSTAQALGWYENGLDFADAIHLATSLHCTAFYTFDDRFMKRATSLIEFNVLQP